MTAKTILAIGCHNDDIELRCGGTLAKFAAAGARVIYVMMGRVDEPRAAERLGAVESIALGYAGFWNWNGAGGDASEKRRPLAGLDAFKALRDEIRQLVLDKQPDLVLTHHGDDHHPDHYTVSKAVQRAVRQLAVEGRFRGELWFWEPGGLAGNLPFVPTVGQDIAAWMTAKESALRFHVRQLQRAPVLLQQMWKRGRRWGYRFGCEYAEPFIAVTADQLEANSRMQVDDTAWEDSAVFERRWGVPCPDIARFVTPDSSAAEAPAAGTPADTAATAPPAWPDEAADITYRSAADGTAQPMRFVAPPGGRPAPLLVYLHPWSCDYQRPDAAAHARWCLAQGWAACFPNFRGPNRAPEACGSERVVQDILDAVAYARTHAAVDPARIHLLGVSGGGYAALLMAGRAPDLWAGVSAWVPIYDLADWHDYCRQRGAKYTRELEAVCGGAPGSSAAADAEYRLRSASAWLPRAAAAAIDIAAGIHDEVIPVRHALRAFQALARPEDRLADADLERLDRDGTVPASLGPAPDDPAYGAKRVLFRRVSGRVRITLFEGGHEILACPALEFLSRQRRGDPPAWT